MRTIDWAQVERFIEERKPVEVSAGLLEDWFWTAATIYENGEWEDRDRAYVTSTWATPGFKAELPNGDTVEVVASKEQNEAEAAAHEVARKANREALAELAKSIESQPKG